MIINVRRKSDNMEGRLLKVTYDNRIAYRVKMANGSTMELTKERFNKDFNIQD